jgi:probable rRNA maturation factor
MTVLIKDSQRSLKTDKRRIKKIIEDLLTSLNLQDKSLSILFVNNNTIKKLNKNYFDKDRPTNVISFSYRDDSSCEIIGDIAISLERAKEEAEGINCHFYERVFALLIHGLLHVLGFDHKSGEKEARKMRYREKKLLDYVCSHEIYKILVLQKQQRAISNEQ